jgi:RNA polymerase sigma-54 factor
MLLQPRMLQAIAVLQLPSLELSTFLTQAALENEALELEAPVSAEAPGATETFTHAGWDATDRHDEWLQNQPGPGRGGREQLEEQLSLLAVSEDLVPWVRFVIDTLDGSGYLTPTDEQLLSFAAERGLEPDAGRLGRAIALVQGLEPRGVGARNAVEALLLQLDPGDEDYALLCRLLEEFLEELAKNKLPSVAKAMGIEVEHLQALLETLGALNHRPEWAGGAEDAPAILPDVVVELRPEGGFDVRVEGAGLPAVTVDPEVSKVAKDRNQPKEVRAYLKEKVEKARWIVEAVEQRHATLVRVAVMLFERQRAFVEEGPSRLVPLRMHELATELELAVSTVSRTVAGKHAQTPWGVFPLRHFFQAGTGQDEAVARDNVQEAVREIFETEDKKHPLSDDEVVAALAGKGVEIARRTVAKHRKELGIPSSYRRREY